MLFSEWFDVKNIDHLKAYRQLQNTGAWPVGFIPSGIEMGPHWQFLLLSQMTDAYLDWRFGHGLFCAECRAPVNDDDAVWVDPETKAATTGESGKPFHVGCAPEQHVELELTEEALKQIYGEIQEK
jgi:hypothetical protein